MKPFNLLSLLFAIPLIISQSALAQNNVGIGTTTPRAGALLDLNANNLGLLLPRVDRSLLTGLSAGDNGLMVYDTMSGNTGIWYWTGTSWNLVSSFGSQAANTVFSAPDGVAGLPSFRLLVANDIPNLNTSKLTAGTLPIVRGGTNSTAAPVNGGMAYGTGTAYAFSAAGTAGQLLQSNGAAAPTWVNAPGAGWLLTGNAGTNPTTNFIGTTDAQAVVFKTNNTEAMRITNGGKIGIGGIVSPLHALTVLGANGTNRTSASFTDGVNSTFRIGHPTLGFAAIGAHDDQSLQLGGFNVFDASFTPWMTLLQPTGNVGIGTTAPTAQLHTTGAVRFQGLVGPGVVSVDAAGNLGVAANNVTGTGTVNKVAFWNSASTISANTNLHWDNTNTRLGIGTATPNYQHDVAGGASTAETILLQLRSQFTGTGTATAIRLSNTNAVAGATGHVDLISTRNAAGQGEFSVRTNNTERMRIVGTGSVGIGTAIPSQLLHINGGASVYQKWSTTNTGQLLSDGFDIGVTAAQNVELVQRENAAMLFFTNNIERMRVSNTGNVGIGVIAPSAQLHTTGTVRFQGLVGPGVLSVDAAGNLSVAANNVTGTGTVNKVAFWNSASTVSANTNLHWDNTNERLGIGTAIPSYQHDIVGGASGAEAILMQLRSPFAVANTATTLRISNTTTATGTTGYVDITAFRNGTAGELVIKPNGTENFRVSNNGASIIGQGTGTPNTVLNVTSSSTWGTAINIGNSSSGGSAYQLVSAGSAHPDLPVGSFAIASLAGNAFVFSGSTGGVGLGSNPTTLSKVYVLNENNDFSDGLWLRNARTSNGSTYGIFNQTSNSGTGFLAGYYTSVSGGTAASRWSFYGTGGPAFLATGAWQTSDERLKQNINKVNGALDMIGQISAYSYTFKRDGVYSNFNFPEGEQIGFLASELEKVLPAYVNESDHPIPGRENAQGGAEQTIRMKSVNYSGIIPILTQAIKEQQEMIEALKREVLELKNK